MLVTSSGEEDYRTRRQCGTITKSEVRLQDSGPVKVRSGWQAGRMQNDADDGIESEYRRCNVMVCLRLTWLVLIALQTSLFAL